MKIKGIYTRIFAVIILLSPIMLIISSCSKTSPAIPSNYMAATINGKTISGIPTIARYGMNDSMPIITLMVPGDHNMQEVDLYLAGYANNNFAPGKYLLKSGDTCMAAYRVGVDWNSLDAYYTRGGVFSGTMSVTGSGRVVSGSFSFTAEDFYGNSIVVTNGILNQVHF